MISHHQLIPHQLDKTGLSHHNSVGTGCPTVGTSCQVQHTFWLVQLFHLFLPKPHTPHTHVILFLAKDAVLYALFYTIASKLHMCVYLLRQWNGLLKKIRIPGLPVWILRRGCLTQIEPQCESNFANGSTAWLCWTSTALLSTDSLARGIMLPPPPFVSVSEFIMQYGLQMKW